MFITFEGIDASGKTTQMRLLEKYLLKHKYDILVTRQPGGTKIGQLIRGILLDPENTQMDSVTEVLLYMADRIQHLREIIIPALKQGKIVFCDRYHDATLAYQGGGRQLDLSWLEPLQKKFVLVPDLTIWFDVSVEESQRRLNQRNLDQNVENCRLESEDETFFNRIRQGYQNLHDKEPHRFIKISAADDIEVIQQKILDIVLFRLK
ncbi:dTMP kinase [bacterium]|nr:dTMP kinase [bacterium]